MNAEATNPPYYLEVLRSELQRRMNRNSAYSVRAFAQSLGMDSSALSQILAGKRSISVKVIEKLFGGLELSVAEQQRFVASVLEVKNTRGTKNVSTALKSRVAQTVTAAPKAIGLDQFQVMSDWYHLAILEMTMKSNFKCDPVWIARQLGITRTEAAVAIRRLKELELLEEVDGRWRKTNVSVDTKDKSKTSAFHRKRQRQILERSAHSLENDPIEERNHSGVTVCVDPDLIPEAKRRIHQFLWELTEFLESGKSSRVYELNVQMFPLEKK